MDQDDKNRPTHDPLDELFAKEDTSSAVWVISGIVVVTLIVIAYFVFTGHESPSAAPTVAPATTRAAAPTKG